MAKKKHNGPQNLGRGVLLQNYKPAAKRAAAKPLSFGNQHPGMTTPKPPKPKAAAPPAGATPAATPAGQPPAAPARVDPFFNGDDMAAINDFTTKYVTDFANLDAGLADQQTDTDYQKTQTNSQAKQAAAGTQDAMIARGLFKSSIKDAALYDIEAQRALSTKFLDDKMTAATLNAGTQKKILGDSKKRFDEAMLLRKGENAATINDSLSAAWADQMASYNTAHPAAPTAPGAPPKPLSFGNQHPGMTTPKPLSFGNQHPGMTTPKPKPINTAQGSGSSKPYRWPNGTMHTKPYRGN